MKQSQPALMGSWLVVLLGRNRAGSQSRPFDEAVIDRLLLKLQRIARCRASEARGIVLFFGR